MYKRLFMLTTPPNNRPETIPLSWLKRLVRFFPSFGFEYDTRSLFAGLEEIWREGTFSEYGGKLRKTGTDKNPVEVLIITYD